MGTLTSCSFSAANLKLRLNPIGCCFRERIQLFERKNNCYLCKDILKRQQNSHRIFGRFKCFSTNGDAGSDGEDDNLAKKSNLATAASRDEAEERSSSSSSNDLDSEKSRASISPQPPTTSPVGPGYNNFQVDSFKLMELLGPEKVDPSDVKLVKEKLFGYSTFWVTREEPFGDLGEGILFLGNLRGQREEVFAKLQSELAELMGDKYNLFMVEEPNSEGPDPRGGPRVSFGMLRKEVSEPGPTTLWQYVIALLLFLLTIGSSVELGIASQINRLPPEVVKYFTDPNAIEPPDMQLLYPFVESALPLAYGVLGVQLFHEVGHFLAAFPKKVKLSIPYFIPNITLGSFGAITQFKSILPDRKTKVDISLAGPFAGAALSSSMFTVGLLLSSNPDAAGDLVQVPSMLFQGSLLLGLISRATLGYAAMHAATVSIHPLVITGWCGLTTSAFNMLPVGCLDGGRAVQGAFGKNALNGFGLTTYALLGLGVLGGPLSLPWGLYVLICQTPEKPCLNDVTEVGTWRRTVLTVAIFLLVLTLLPIWDELAEELGIGLVTTF
uniref:Peptidase M50 domain-containing protein n=1 Tax=Davidia involucrata TaxID=16924 RepID=A0A5B6ZE85_DAVIN